MGAHETWVRSLGEGAAEKIAALTVRLEDGVVVEPVYTTRRAWTPAEARFIESAASTRVIAPLDVWSDASVADALEGGADGLWVDARLILEADEAGALAPPTRDDTWLFVDGDARAFDEVARRVDALGSDVAQRWTLIPVGEAAPLRLGGSPRRFAHFHSGAGAHADGASPAFELGMIAASCLAGWRSAESSGSLEDAVSATMLGVVAEADILVTIAKVRALRLLWGKLQGFLGVPGSAPSVCGLSSTRRQAALDVHSNLIRNATEVFGLVVAGVDACVALPFDALLEAPSALGRRLARNTILIARDEAHLGFVKDPAAGSYYLESLTRSLAEQGWEALRFIEREGGAETSAVKEKLAGYAAARSRAVAERRNVVVGVNDFAATGEAAGARARDDIARDTSSFEAMVETTRAMGEVRVGFIAMGRPSGAAPRRSFAQRFFEAGRFIVSDTLANDPSIDDVLSFSAVVDFMCLCGSDDAYVAGAGTYLAPLVERGVPVWMAGRPRSLDPADRASLAGQIYLGCDAIALMEKAREAVARRRAKRGGA